MAAFWHTNGMSPWPLTCLSLMLAACSSPVVQQQRLEDGTLSVTCRLPMDECVQRVKDECPYQRFHIIDGASQTQLRDAPPFERAYYTSHLHLSCTDSDDKPLFSIGGKKPEPAKTAAPPPARGRVCGVGETRACVGSGACQGGQVCLPTGEGFGVCDCGSLTPAAAAPPAAVSGPQPSTAPADGAGSSPP